MKTRPLSKARTAIAGGLVALSCAIVCPLAAQSPHGHVRSTERHLQKLILTARVRSVSFARLLRRLDAADVIVYLTCSAIDARPPAPRLSLLSRAGSWRYVIVHLRCPAPDDQQIVMLAHELRHAVEIADARHVVDQRSMHAYYLRIGHEVPCGTSQVHAFDTQSARTTEAVVRRELAVRVGRDAPAGFW